MKNANENFKMIKKHFTVLKIGFKSNADKMPLNSFYVILKHFEKMQGFKCFSYDFKKLHLTEDFIKIAVRISGLTFDLYLDDVTGFLDGRDGPGWNHLTENKVQSAVLCVRVYVCVLAAVSGLTTPFSTTSFSLDRVILGSCRKERKSVSRVRTHVMAVND